MYKGFTRDFGCPVRIRVRTIKELSKLIDDNSGFKPCFLSISHYQENTPYLAFIPFDFDGRVERVIKDTNRLCQYFDDNDIPYDMKFSGDKGTHVVIPLEFNSETPLFISPHTLSDIQMHCIAKNKLETFDYHLRGNINALLRIPYTIHEKTKNTSVTLRSCDRTISVKEICEKLSVDEFKYTFSNNFVSDEKTHPYPCLEYFIKVPNPLNYCRVAFVIYRLKQGRKLNEILSELAEQNWVDWNENKTRYHLKKIIGRGYSMPNCTTLKRYGLCLNCKYDDSKIFDKITKHLRGT